MSKGQNGSPAAPEARVGQRRRGSALLGAAIVFVLGFSFSRDGSVSEGGDLAARTVALHDIKSVQNRVVIVRPGATLHFTDADIPEIPQTDTTAARPGNIAKRLGQGGMFGGQEYLVIRAPLSTKSEDEHPRDRSADATNWLGFVLAGDMVKAEDMQNAAQVMLYVDSGAARPDAVYTLPGQPLDELKYGNRQWLPVDVVKGTDVEIGHFDYTDGGFSVPLGTVAVGTIVGRKEVCDVVAALSGVQEPFYTQNCP